MNNDPGGAAHKAAKLHQTRVLPLTPLKAPARKPRTLSFASVDEMVAQLKPSEPVQALRPHVIKRLAKWFVGHFPGDVLYAVKTNPDPRVLNYLYRSGVRHFDVASLAEVRRVAGMFPDAQLYFMHPVKSREAIREAYFVHGVRHFALDSHEELKKLREATGAADDLALHVRLSIPNDKAAMSLAGKFGIPLDRAASLIAATRKAAASFGLCFHVGSQCMDPQSYATTIGYMRDLLVQNDVKLDMLDVGGGFPSVYPGMMPPPMQAYMDAIREAAKTLPVDEHFRLLCEPGRALAAEGGSIIARVELRKGSQLYLNDGAFGSLFDAAHTSFRFPVRAVRPDAAMSAEMKPFSFFGPTCDSMDVMAGPFMLPADIAEGDWIEIGQLGAYGQTMRTGFNGFYSDTTVEVADEPMMSIGLQSAVCGVAYGDFSSDPNKDITL